MCLNIHRTLQLSSWLMISTDCLLADTQFWLFLVYSWFFFPKQTFYQDTTSEKILLLRFGIEKSTYVSENGK